MICFYCKAEIDSDHGCQEIVEMMEGETTPLQVGEIMAYTRDYDRKVRGEQDVHS